MQPAPGNHDRQIRPRGKEPPKEPVYANEALAIRSSFPLPDDGWRWRFDLPDVRVRFIALDLTRPRRQATLASRWS